MIEVREDHLVSALERGLISGIGIDVLTNEPPSADNPLMRVMKRHDVIITPFVDEYNDDIVIIFHDIIHDDE